MKLQERINRWGQCKICFTYGPYTKHHVKPRAHRPKNVSTRKVKLCARCHLKVHETFTNDQLSEMEWIDTADAIRIILGKQPIKNKHHENRKETIPSTEKSREESIEGSQH